MTKDSPNFGILMFGFWVKIESDCASEDGSILRNDGNAGAEDVKWDLGDGNTVDLDVSLGRFDDPEPLFG
jgi:hypothetical protein